MVELLLVLSVVCAVLAIGARAADALPDVWADRALAFFLGWPQ